eukprot:Gb_40028 [translate_table: standard]
MAMSISASNIFDHFFYHGNGKAPITIDCPLRLTNANLVLGRGASELCSPLYSRRFGVRALDNGRNFPRREGDFDKEKIMSRSHEEEAPYRILPDGSKVYLDELDILALLDPPKYLVPLDKRAFNLAAYFWKKIGDIPQERRYRLLHMLQPKHISRVWEFAGRRYNGESADKNNAASMLPSIKNELLLPEFWTGQINGVPWPIGWMSRFKKAFFLGKDGNVYGQVLPGGFLVRNIANYFSPLYFLVRNASEVVATEEPCDLACEFGEGQVHLLDLPAHFPKPAKHPGPFNDQLVVYIRSAGPGVLVGQAWQEGRELEQVPKKFLGELLLIKDYAITK